MAALCTAPAVAQGDTGFQGAGWIGSNDQYGDGEDRWRTASLTISLLYGSGWSGLAPERFGELFEVRLHGEIIAPSNLSDPAPDDRRYAGVLGFGLHSHAHIGETDYRIGADLVVIGPQTGLGDLQERSHDLIPNQPSPGPALDDQIGDTLRLAVSAEAARSLDLGGVTRLRPFVGGRIGDETFARIGADLIVGSWGLDGLILRDTVTGQLYQGREDAGDGFSLVLGGDVASVASSVFLPDGGAAELSPVRSRVRAGVYWQRGGLTLNYGLTWLGTEFDSQPEGQMLGSASLRLVF